MTSHCAYVYDWMFKGDKNKCKQCYLIIIRTLFLTSLQNVLSIYFQAKNDFKKSQRYK